MVACRLTADPDVKQQHMQRKKAPMVLLPVLLALQLLLAASTAAAAVPTVEVRMVFEGKLQPQQLRYFSFYAFKYICAFKMS
jgi:hypothetical protein